MTSHAVPNCAPAFVPSGCTADRIWNLVASEIADRSVFARSCPRNLLLTYFLANQVAERRHAHTASFLDPIRDQTGCQQVRPYVGQITAGMFAHYRVNRLHLRLAALGQLYYAERLTQGAIQN